MLNLCLTINAIFKQNEAQMILYISTNIKSASNPCSNKLFVDNTAVCYCFRGESVVQHQGQINFQMDIPFFGVIFTGGKQFRNINLNLNVASDPNLMGFAIQHISSQAVFIECQFKVNVNDSIQQSSLVSGKGDLKIFNCQLEFNSTSLETAGLVNTAMALSIKDSSLLVDIDGDQIGVIAIYAYGAIEVVRVNLLGAVHSLTSQLVYSCQNNPQIKLTNIINNLNVVSVSLNGLYQLIGSILANVPDLICETSFSIQPIEPMMVSAQSTTQSASTMSGETVFNNQVFFDTTLSFVNGFTTGSATAFSLFGTQITQFYKLRILSTSVIQISCQGALLSINSGANYNMIVVQVQMQTNSSLNFLQNSVESSQNAKIRNIRINSIITCTATGQFSLIQSIRGNISIKFYKVSGTYNSLSSSCFGSQQLFNTGILNLQYCMINPTTFTVGNISSFLFVTISGKLFIARTSIIYGDTSNLKLLTSVLSSIPIRFQFGGVVYQISSLGMATVTNITLLFYINFNTQYVQNSGSILGIIDPSATNVSLKQFCMSMKYNILNADTFGCLGFINTIVKIEDVTFDINYVNEFIRYKIGFIGAARSQLVNASLKNIKSNLQQMVDLVNNGIQDYSSVILAFSESQNILTFQKIKVSNGQANTYSKAGLIIGFTQGGKIEMNEIIINSSEINCQHHSGLIIGYIQSNGNVSISNFLINDSSLMQFDAYAEYLGGVVGIVESSQVSISEGVVTKLGIEHQNNYVSAIVSKSQSSNCSLYNISVNDSTVNGSQNVGAVIANLLDSNLTIFNLSTNKNLINGTGNVGIFSWLNCSNASVTLFAQNYTDLNCEQNVETITRLQLCKMQLLILQ
ncbi:Hypothetical_protein [Hexamita inflata]|uniref:Hypothetical_protein n=1 Tax=Hexamita inflata TaxID=28002 RepID=A0AA86P690_9EUKA|nr:Hypothetical protein HINF_LOCUS19136 [Hexamita inflata]